MCPDVLESGPGNVPRPGVPAPRVIAFVVTAALIAAGAIALSRIGGSGSFDGTHHRLTTASVAPASEFGDDIPTSTEGFVTPTTCLALAVASQEIFHQAGAAPLASRSYLIRDQQVVEQLNLQVPAIGGVIPAVRVVIPTCAHTVRDSRTGTVTSAIHPIDTTSLDWEGSVGYAERVKGPDGVRSALTVLLPAQDSALAIQVNQPGALAGSALTERIRPLARAAIAGAAAASDAKLRPVPSPPAQLQAPPGLRSIGAVTFSHIGDAADDATRSGWIWGAGNDVLTITTTQYPTASTAARRFASLPAPGMPGDAFQVKFPVPGVPGARGVELADAGQYDEVQFRAGRYVCDLMENASDGGNKPLAARAARLEYRHLIEASGA